MLRAVNAVRLPYVLARERITRQRKPRIPEPMLMEDPESVTAFDGAGIPSSGVLIPVYDLCARAISRLLPPGGCVVDLGCGTGRGLAHLAQRRPDARIVGVELSDEMLEVGRKVLAEQGVDDRVELVRGDITDLSATSLPAPDVVSCSFALHQLPTERELTSCVGQVAELRAGYGCAVWLFDLLRLKHEGTYRDYMATFPEQDPALQHDAVASERAAWSAQELDQVVDQAGLKEVQRATMRLLPAYGAQWIAGREGRGAGDSAWRPVPLQYAQSEAWTLRRLFVGLP